MHNRHAGQIGLGATREAKRCHKLGPRSGQVQFLADTREHVVIGDPTGIAFLDSRTQSGKLRLMLLFFALQRSQCRTHHFARVFVAATLDFGLNQIFESSVKFTLRRGNPQPSTIRKA